MPAENEPLDPDWIVSQEFDSSFRGFDQGQVRSYLRKLAKAIRAEQDDFAKSAAQSVDQAELLAGLNERVVRLDREAEELRNELAAANSQIVDLKATPPTVSPEDLDPSQLTKVLGEETVRVLDSARIAAADITAKAERESAEREIALDRLQSETTSALAEQRKKVTNQIAEDRAAADSEIKELQERAKAEVAKLRVDSTTAAKKERAEAKSEAQKLSTEAKAASESSKNAANDVAAAVKLRGEEVAKQTRLAAEAAADKTGKAAAQIVSDADAEAARLRAEAAADVETARDSAREEARLMLTEAQTLREKVLSDLVDRRRIARQQIDQAKAARDRLVRALVSASQDIDGATKELNVSVPDAKRAMEQVRAKGGQNSAQQTADLANRLDEARTSGKTVGPEQLADSDTTGKSPGGAGGANTRVSKGAEVETEGSVNSEVKSKPKTKKSVPADARPDQEKQKARKQSETSPEEDLVVSLEDNGVEAAASDDLDSIFAKIRAEGTSPGKGEEPASTSRAAAKWHGKNKASDKKAVDEAAVGKVGGGKHKSGQSDSKTSPEDEAVGDGQSVTETVGHDLAEDDAAIEVLPAFVDRDVALTRFGPDLRRKLKRALADDQSDVLDRLRRSKKLSGDDLPGSDEELSGFRKAAEQGLAGIGTAGALSMGDKPFKSSQLSSLLDKLARDIHVPLRAKIERAIAASDGDIEDVLGPIRAHYRDVRSSDLPSLTDDAMAEAFAIGVYGAIAAKEPLAWVVDPRADTSPDCFDNTLESAVVKPKPFPTGHQRPLGEPGCRCLVLPANLVE